MKGLSGFVRDKLEARERKFYLLSCLGGNEHGSVPQSGLRTEEHFPILHLPKCIALKYLCLVPCGYSESNTC